jgi:ABC-type phosphate transport system substrate-binding protein
MRLARVFSVVTFVIVAFAPCFAHHTAVIVNKENNVGQMTSAHLSKMLRGEIKKWPDGKPVVLVLHKDSSGEMETLERLNKMSVEQLKASFATEKDSLLWVDNDADVVKQVQTTPGALGLVDVKSVDGSIRVVRIDGKLPMESGYLPH